MIKQAHWLTQKVGPPVDLLGWRVHYVTKTTSMSYTTYQVTISEVIESVLRQNTFSVDKITIKRAVGRTM